MTIMPVMKTNQFALVLLSLVMSSTPLVMAAPACSVNAKVPATARIFATASKFSGWREYASMQDIPALRLGSGVSAQFWQQGKRKRSVYMVEPSQDFWTMARYCFDSEDQLESVGFEIITPLGWGLRTEGFMSVGALNATSSEFFDTKNGKAIARPAGVDNFPVELKPTLYLAFGELPFAQLLKADVKCGSAGNLASAAN
jgi:hypothetical protein